MPKMIRIQFELPEDKLDDLEKLMNESAITTKKDLLNNAVTLFDWAISERKKGNIIASIDERTGRTKELIMPALSISLESRIQEGSDEVEEMEEVAKPRVPLGGLDLAENAA